MVNFKWYYKLILLYLLTYASTIYGTCKDTSFCVTETIIRYKENENKWKNESMTIITGKVIKPDSALIAQSEIDLNGYKLDYSDLPCLFVKITKQFYGRKLGKKVMVFNENKSWEPKYKVGSSWLFVLIANHKLPFKAEKYLLMDICTESSLKQEKEKLIGKFYSEENQKLDTINVDEFNHFLKSFKK